ncbi:hypothetical protein PINS_up018600 [Pythium insidiosum]|nr:hypothetical protein PINS_up018600 [Pythium insidiosum]
MVGSAGADVDNAKYYDVPWRKAAIMDYGYGRLHVYNATHAQFEFQHNRNERVEDRRVDHHGPPVGGQSECTKGGVQH